MENSENPMSEAPQKEVTTETTTKTTSTETTPQPKKKKGWIWFILAVIILGAIAAIIFLAQSGMFFKGSVSDSGVIGDAIVLKSSITEKTNGPFINVSSTDGDTCIPGEILGTPDCPFSDLNGAEKLINDLNLTNAELRLQAGGTYNDTNGLLLSGGVKSVIGGWDANFTTSSATTPSLLYTNIKIENATGKIKNILFRNAGFTDKNVIEVSTSNEELFEISDITMDNMSNGISLIKFSTDNSRQKINLTNSKFYNSNVTNGSIIEVVGNGLVTIKNNHINNSSANTAIVHLDRNDILVNNLISNTTRARVVTNYGILIEEGGDVKLINNTIVDSDFNLGTVKQNGQGVMWIINNLMQNLTFNRFYDVAEINKLSARGNAWEYIGTGGTTPVYGLVETNNFSCIADFVGGDNTKPDYYKLKATTNCLNKGVSNSNFLALNSPDYFETTRPQGTGVDPGFSEFIDIFIGILAVDNRDTVGLINTPVCGNGTLENGEQCDDGNTSNSDGCSSTCQTEIPVSVVCGNGVVETGEDCDDGNTVAGDGCNATCKIEPPIQVICGDGIVAGTEQCDDGNTVNGDGCSSVCQTEQPVGSICGDGVKAPNEQCDDGNTSNSDGCSSTCLIEQQVGAVCGNGTLETGEACEDGNIVNGDGCSSLCQFEGTVNDLCPNITGDQTTIPSGYHRVGNECLPITTPTGDDDDDELICGEWTDVSSNDPEFSIWEYLCDRGIMMGHEDNTFRAEDKLTRAELLAIAFRASDYENEYDLDDDASYCFNDVDNEWFAKYACTGENLGFVQGYSGNLFKPGQNVILAEGLKLFLGALDEPFTIESNSDRWYFTMLQDAADDNYLPYTLTDEKVVGPIELTRRKAANMIYRILIYR